jgi:hypothetical protein
MSSRLPKSGFISQTTKEENLDFICLQETERTDFSSNELKHLRLLKISFGDGLILKEDLVEF